MKLALFHPRIRQRNCASCRAWMYDDQHQISTWAGKPLPRPADSPTPCWKCPKGNPGHAAGYERDMARIERTLELYFQFRASSGRALPGGRVADPLLARNLAIIDAIVRRWERMQSGVAPLPSRKPILRRSTR